MTTTQKTRRETILEAAADLFREKGYAASTMRDIADVVGIEAASLYNHIKSKEDLLHEICFKVGNHFITEMDHINGLDENVLSKVTRLIHLHIDMTTSQLTMTSVANDEWRHLNERQLAEFLEMRDHYENAFRAILKEGITTGDLKPMDADVMLYTILSSVKWLQYWFREDRPIDVDQIKQQVTELLLKGLQN